MDDLISRQDAIDALSKTGDEILQGGILRGTVYRILENLPSVQPERKKGKWIVRIRDNRAYFICSECNDEVDICGYGFCPTCGADMRGEEVNKMEISVEHYNKMAERLAELEYKESERQWTPCRERLPEEKGEYMVTVEYFWHGETGRMLTSSRYTKTKGWHISEGRVIAWMPEPELYKED